MKTYQQIEKKVLCPVCNSNDVLLLWTTNSAEAAQHFVLKEKHPKRYQKLVDHLDSLWGQSSCEVVQCKNCDFCFSNPYIAGDEPFYSLAYERSGYPAWKWEYQKSYDVLKRNPKKNLKLLEIGAGNGAFVKKISNSILKKENILCTEFSEYGKHAIESLGIKCISEDVREFSNPNLEEAFDIICMFQVLEHMDQLDTLFQKLNWLMKNNASLIIAVPNTKRISFNELNGALLDMPPNHIGRWNKKCFELMGKKNGFQIKDYRVEDFNFFAMARQFIVYQMLRKSQVSGSFNNNLFRIRSKYFLRVMQLFSFAFNSIAAIPALIKKILVRVVRNGFTL